MRPLLLQARVRRALSGPTLREPAGPRPRPRSHQDPRPRGEFRERPSMMWVASLLRKQDGGKRGQRLERWPCHPLSLHQKRHACRLSTPRKIRSWNGCKHSGSNIPPARRSRADRFSGLLHFRAWVASSRTLLMRYVVKPHGAIWSSPRPRLWDGHPAQEIRHAQLVATRTLVWPDSSQIALSKRGNSIIPGNGRPNSAFSR